jgi:hypothetical protein
MSLDRLNEAFKMLDALNEEMFDTSLDGINKLSDTMNGDNEDDIIKIIDADAEDEEGIQDSYVGKVIINCNVCHSHIFANQEDITIDDSGIVNGEETCPYCGEMEGFTVIGQIEEFSEESVADDDTEGEKEEDDSPIDDQPANSPKNESFRLPNRKALHEGGKSVDFSKIKKVGKKLIKEDTCPHCGKDIPDYTPKFVWGKSPMEIMSADTIGYGLKNSQIKSAYRASSDPEDFCKRLDETSDKCSFEFKKMERSTNGNKYIFSAQRYNKNYEPLRTANDLVIVVNANTIKDKVSNFFKESTGLVEKIKLGKDDRLVAGDDNYCLVASTLKYAPFNGDIVYKSFKNGTHEGTIEFEDNSKKPNDEEAIKRWKAKDFSESFTKLTEAPIYDLTDDEIEFLNSRKTTRIDISDREAKLIDQRRKEMKDSGVLNAKIRSRVIDYSPLQKQAVSNLKDANSWYGNFAGGSWYEFFFTSRVDKDDVHAEVSVTPQTIYFYLYDSTRNGDNEVMLTKCDTSMSTVIDKVKAVNADAGEALFTLYLSGLDYGNSDETDTILHNATSVAELHKNDIFKVVSGILTSSLNGNATLTESPANDKITMANEKELNEADGKRYVIGVYYGAYQFINVPTNELSDTINREIEALRNSENGFSGDDLFSSICGGNNDLRNAIIYRSKREAVDAINIIEDTSAEWGEEIFADRDEAYDFIIDVDTLPEKLKSTINESASLTEAPYYLDTKYDSRKSFYNKAMVSDSTDELYSYGVHVMSIENGKPVIKCREDQLSQTTLRHIKEFLKQKGFPAISKQQILNDYAHDVPTREIKLEACGETSNGGINEDLRNSPYNQIIVRHFDYTGSDKFFDIIADLIDRVDDFSNEEEIWEAIDAGLIYTRDQWEVYMHYCDMGDSTDKMYESLFGDIFAICDEISNSETPSDLDESLKSYMKTRLNKRFVEGFNNINVETDDQKLTMTQDENGKVTVSTEPLDTVATEGSGEMIAPVSDELANEIIDANSDTSDETTDEGGEDLGLDVDAATDGEGTTDEEIPEEPAEEQPAEGEETSEEEEDDTANESLTRNNGSNNLEEGVGDLYRKVFDKPASISTQQSWESELNGECGKISDRRRKSLERKFARQRDWEARHNSNTPNKEVDLDITDFDDAAFSTLGEKYLKNVYENVESFHTTKVSNNESTLIVEGVIDFKSGVSKKTGFIFEACNATVDGKVSFLGENKHFSTSKKAFTLNGRVDNKTLVMESLSYNYRPSKSNNRIVGKVRSK